MITINSLIKEYNSRNKSVLALDNVSINIPSGSIFGIIGKSGSGKSTLLQIVGAMEKPTSGSIVVDGFSIEKMNKTNLSKFRREKIGFVFQSFYLQNYLNVYENVELPMIGKNIKSFEKKIEFIKF
ncbi:MAG: ATP-binding cassette domain-containing protein [Thermales bacterium]|nr:ATP-binding cassette domain-containing protein [Thermales bacterium]